MTAPETTYKAGQLAEISWALNEACASHGHREMAEWRPVVGGKRPGWWLTKSGMSIPDHAASDVVLMKTMPEDFRSDTLIDLERARTVAVELEQQCALLARQVADGRQLVIELHRNGVLSDPEAAVLFGILRGVPSPVADEVQP